MKLDIYLQVLPEIPKRRCHSFVYNHIALFHSHHISGAVTLIKLDGTPVSKSPHASDWGVLFGAGTDTAGIVVGTGSTPVDIEDYKLQNKLPHGTGPGSLSYGACSASGPSRTDNSMQIAASRTFTNLSGAPITIREAGIYSATGTVYAVMTVREVISPIIIPNGAARTLTFTIAISA